MNINEAIKILQLADNPAFEGDSNDFFDALKLGIEALKRIRQRRRSGAGWNPILLPGETKE